MLPLAHALVERGHTVRIVIPPWDDPTARPGTTTISGVEVITLPLPARLPNTLALTYDLLRHALARTSTTPHSALRTPHSTDVVHVFKPVGYSGLAGFTLSAMRVPWVLDVDDWEGPGGFSDKNPYSLPERLSITAMEALLPRMAGALTAASHTLEARAWSMGLPRCRVAYMPNGVSHDRYDSWSAYSHNSPTTHSPLTGAIRNQYNLHNGPIILLYTRFAEFPYRWPLHILKRILSDHPTATLLIVGSGFFHEEEKLRADAARMGLTPHLAITGRVPEAALPAFLSLADVAIYPMADTLLNRAKSPVKVIEPMLLDIPIVAHRVGQAAEFVGDAGVLIEPGNLEAMALAVSALLKDPSRRAHLGAKAEQRVWTHFNWRTLSAAAERMYNAALGTESHQES
jgi:glycosyltransferase involved in cell wall biosynthesis